MLTVLGDTARQGVASRADMYACWRTWVFLAFCWSCAHRLLADVRGKWLVVGSWRGNRIATLLRGFSSMRERIIGCLRELF